MILNHSNKSNSVSDRDDFFSQKKLADEAKKISEQANLVKKDQERRRIQVQIDNKKRELTLLESNVRSLEQHLFSNQREKVQAEQEIFRFEQQVKQLEGGKKYLTDSDSERKVREKSFELKEADIEKRSEEYERQIQQHGKDLDQKRTEVDIWTQKIKDIEDELLKARVCLDQNQKEIALIERLIEEAKNKKAKLGLSSRSIDQEVKQMSDSELKDKKILSNKDKEIEQLLLDIVTKKKLFDQFDYNEDKLRKEFEKIKREIDAKKNEISDLERQRDAIR